MSTHSSKLGSPNLKGFSLLDYPHSYPITPYSFTLAGLGHAGVDCGKNSLSHFAESGDAIKYSPLSCKKIECPKCWPDWAKRMVFNLALKIEAWAHYTKTRPYTCVYSVAPEKVKDWTWERVNHSLFRRGYRRSKDHAGIEGGVVIFHPYRIKPHWKRHFRRTGESRGCGMWKIIRQKVKSGEPLLKYASLGPHAHAIVFGKPKGHSSKDFVLAFNDEDERPVELKTLEDVVGFLFYLLTHTGTLNQLRQTPTGIFTRRIHTVRTFGILRNIDPLKLLSPEDYVKLAARVAQTIGMEYVNGELRYPASPEGFDTGEKKIWIPIHRLSEFLNNEAWLSRLSYSQCRYFFSLEAYVKQKGRPPDPGELPLTDDVVEFCSRPTGEMPLNSSRLIGQSVL